MFSAATNIQHKHYVSEANDFCPQATNTLPTDYTFLTKVQNCPAVTMPCYLQHSMPVTSIRSVQYLHTAGFITASIQIQYNITEQQHCCLQQTCLSAASQLALFYI